MSDARTDVRRSEAVEVDQDTRLALYRLVVEIRTFETRAYDLFLQNLVKGTSHLSLGQEAIAAGFAVAMRPDDYTFCTYRGHAHTLARGASMTAVMAELLGREAGLMAGKGGSMHLTSVEHGVMGSYAIVGAHMPIAAGAVTLRKPPASSIRSPANWTPLSLKHWPKLCSAVGVSTVPATPCSVCR